MSIGGDGLREGSLALLPVLYETPHDTNYEDDDDYDDEQEGGRRKKRFCPPFLPERLKEKVCLL